jgi:hypothetical protein
MSPGDLYVSESGRVFHVVLRSGDDVVVEMQDGPPVLRGHLAIVSVAAMAKHTLPHGRRPLVGREELENMRAGLLQP